VRERHEERHQRAPQVERRQRVGQLLAELGVLPGTAMVIRGDVLLTDAEVVEDADDVEIRAVISGGAS
jgi:sulfur carrier protein ThiS